MRRLISTIGLPKEEWLKIRKTGITGTDAGAITGMNPYASAFSIYQDKISNEIEEFDNEAMRQGRDMEEYVAKRFEEETGLKVRRANAIYQNEEHPIMLADFDRIIVGEKAGLECKTVSPYSADKWADGEIPLHYQMQVQHYLAVSGFDCWYVAALIFGREFIIRKIERDEELIQNLITIEERFWNENVIPRVMPDPDVEKLLAIKGVGNSTVIGFIAEVGDIGRFTDPKQIQKLAGLEITKCASGKKKGQPCISKRGRRSGMFH